MLFLSSLMLVKENLTPILAKSSPTFACHACTSARSTTSGFLLIPYTSE